MGFFGVFPLTSFIILLAIVIVGLIALHNALQNPFHARNKAFDADLLEKMKEKHRVAKKG